LRRPTVGADFLSKRIVLHDTDVALQIWDTAGQERFHQGTISTSFYRGAHGALLVYDVNNEKSIEQIAQWRDECIEKAGNEYYFPIVVVGNKTDLRDQTNVSQRIDQSIILSWCRENSYGHIETSAKDGTGVEAAMMAITALAIESQKSNAVSKSNSDNIKLDDLYVPQSDSYCDGCIK
jgi:Ras-related protein Rab-7A